MSLGQGDPLCGDQQDCREEVTELDFGRGVFCVVVWGAEMILRLENVLIVTNG